MAMSESRETAYATQVADPVAAKVADALVPVVRMMTTLKAANYTRGSAWGYGASSRAHPGGFQIDHS